MLRRIAQLVCAATAAAALAAGPAASAPKPEIALSTATARTVAAATARFSLSVAAHVAGISVVTSERGAISFRRHQAHVYKLVPGSGVPQEIVLIGPWEYTNANVQAAIDDPGVRPWTKLDTRRLPARQRKNRADDLAHVRALAYLSSGAAHAARMAHVRSDGATTHFRGVVEPARVLESVPRSERATIRAVIAADYTSKPFPADFWVDRDGRVVRVRVSYRTAKGGRIAVDGTFSHFGSKVDLRLPSASDIQNITP